MGTVVFATAALSLVTARIHPIQRALIAIRHRSLLGQTTDVTMDDEGFRLQNALGSSYVPWSTVTDVRTNDQTVAFFRDRALVGYVPAIAFASPDEQARVVDFARSRVTRASAAKAAESPERPTPRHSPCSGDRPRHRGGGGRREAEEDSRPEGTAEENDRARPKADPIFARIKFRLLGRGLHVGLVVDRERPHQERAGPQRG